MLELSQKRPGRRAPRAVALALGAGALALAVSITFESAELVGQTVPGFSFWQNGTLVSLHREGWTGPQAGIPLQGQTLVSVDGQAFRDGRAVFQYTARLQPGTPVSYGVRTRAGPREFVVPTMRLQLVDYLLTYGLYLFNALAYLAVAVVALWLRSDLRLARSLAITAGTLGILIVLAVDYLTSYRWVAATQLLEAAAPAAVLSLAVQFPVRRLDRARAANLALALFVGCVAARAATLGLFWEQPALAYRIAMACYLGIAVSLVLLVANTLATLFSPSTAAQRTTAAIVLMGFVPAFALPAVMLPGFILLDWSFSWSLPLALLPIAPLAVLYAVLRHDMLGAERLARLTLGYVLSSMAVVVLFGLMVGIVDRLLGLAESASRPLEFFGIVVLALGFDPLRRRIQAGVDRAFYRSQVDPARELEQSSEELADLSDVHSIQESVEQRLTQALALERCDFALTSGPPEGAALLQAVSFRDETLGWLACGAKRSGAPFSGTERDLVRAVAGQAALALRNAHALEALREAQHALLRSERLAAVGEFSGAVAHGIRNPLAGIRAAAQGAADAAPEGPLAEALSSVLGEADRLEQRIRALLDFSKPQQPKPTRGDLAAVVYDVRDALLPHAEASGVRIELEVEAADEGAALCFFDRNYLEEALLELAGNAVRALDGRGTIRLTLHFEGDVAVLRVADDGPGIPEGIRDRVFELFFTTRPDGTGMGLAAVSRIVEAHGGSIEIERTGADGTTFRIALPRARA